MKQSKGHQAVVQAINMGLDVGYGFTKGAVGKTGNQFEFRSLVCPATMAATDSDRGHINYTDATGNFYIGENAIMYGKPIMASVDSSYIDSDQYRIQALYAMALAAEKNANDDKVHTDITSINLVMGLPVEWYRKDARRLQENAKNWANNKTKVGAIAVVPQPVGTVADLQSDWNGGRQEDFSGMKVALVDVGHGTLDLIEIVNNRVQFESAKGVAEGISRLHHDVYTSLKTETKYKKQFEDSGRGRDEIDEIIRDRSFLCYGEPVNIEPLLRKCIQRTCSSINSIIDETWPKRGNLDRIIITGGGAELLADEFEELIPEKQLIIPEDPGFANAKGFAKLANDL